MQMLLNNGKWTPRATRKGDKDGDPEVPHYVHGGHCNAFGGELGLSLSEAQNICDYANNKRGLS